MYYLLLFLEGILTFISPCLLPMIPLYLAYISGNQTQQPTSRHKALMQVLYFILGYTLIFLLINLFVHSVGRFFLVNQRIIQIISGIWLIVYRHGNRLRR